MNPTPYQHGQASAAYMQPNTPPEHLSPDDQLAWLAGWQQMTDTFRAIMCTPTEESARGARANGHYLGVHIPRRGETGCEQ